MIAKQFKPFQWYVVVWSVFSLAIASSGEAFPKYTTKENALQLAIALDKGYYGKRMISSTYILNDTNKNYYISVILDDGSAHKWYVNQIYDWVKNEKIKLSDNKALIFPYPKQTKFFVLEKNKFNRTALQAKVYVKKFPPGDPLEGQTFHFQVKDFNLISPQEKAFGRDKKTGYYYRYIIDLENGTRELLTYQDAYYVMQRKGLLKDYDGTTFRKAYHITKISPIRTPERAHEITKFGIEILFEEPIQLKSKNIPLEIYEKTIRKTKKTKGGQFFFIDFTIPNAEKTYEIDGIKNLEYLHNIRIVKDFRYPKRLLLHSRFNPDVLNIPPVVTKTGEKKIQITFYNDIDQSVAIPDKSARRSVPTAQKIPRADRKRPDSEYEKLFNEGVSIYNKATTIEDVKKRIEQYTEASEEFENAAATAKSDQEIWNALQKRNSVRLNAVKLILDYVGTQVQKGEEGESKEVLAKYLETAESYTQDEKILTEIRELRQKLNTEKK